MPKIVERLRRQLQSKGNKENAAYGMAVAVLQKSGVLKKGTSNKLTAKGKKRQKLGAAGRAKSRAVAKANAGRKSKARNSKQYSYNKKTNQAVLKKSTKAKVKRKKKTKKKKKK